MARSMRATAWATHLKVVDAEELDSQHQRQSSSHEGSKIRLEMPLRVKTNRQHIAWLDSKRIPNTHVYL